jgi:hypothetical protein
MGVAQLLDRALDRVAGLVAAAGGAARRASPASCALRARIASARA